MTALALHRPDSTAPVEEGLIDRSARLIRLTVGDTAVQLSGDWWQKVGPGTDFGANVYGLDYKLDLISDFTYDTDPIHGDQFEHSTTGMSLAEQWPTISHWDFSDVEGRSSRRSDPL